MILVMKGCQNYNIREVHPQAAHSRQKDNQTTPAKMPLNYELQQPSLLHVAKFAERVGRDGFLCSTHGSLICYDH